MKRDEVAENFRSLMLGPIYGDNEILDRHPLEYYSCGIMYPRHLASMTHKDVKLEEDNESADTMAIETSPEECTNAQNGDSEDGISITDENVKSMYPSSFGMSFLCVDNTEISIECTFSRYSLIKDGNTKGEPKAQTQKEISSKNVDGEGDSFQAYSIKDNVSLTVSGQNKKSIIMKLVGGKIQVVAEYSKLGTGNYYVRILFYNTYNAAPDQGTPVSPKSRSIIEMIAFRPQIIATMKSESLVDISQAIKIDYSSDKETEMLYRNNKNRARGHNCAVEVTDLGSNVTLKTEFLPEVKVKILKTELDDFCPNPNIFSTQVLSEESNKQLVIRNLQEFCKHYENWLSSQQAPEGYANEFDLNQKKCRLIYKRIKQGISLLDRNDEIYSVWKDSHRAMKMQYEKGKGKDNQVLVYRPFQLAFILMSIGELIDKTLLTDDLRIDDMEYRSCCDLIWVATGGGKTEAYLALTAFTILYRRKHNQLDGYGLAVISRYTLRLLTSQQFSRAATLICALEKIRREKQDEYLNDKYPIILGLLIGSAATPNSVNKDELLTLFTYSSNPFPVKVCPWCGAALENNNRKNLNDRDHNSFYMCGNTKLFVHCLNKDCDFHDFLPLNFIDQMLEGGNPAKGYPCHGSSMLISTADKFAMLPFKIPQFQKILFYKRKPDLIIQDELHLIDGTLGSLFGLYETTHELFWDQEDKPIKIIASTATPKEAESQIRLLFDKKTAIFPYPLQSIDDTYFTRLTDGETENEQNGRRLYIGCMPGGIPAKTAARNAVTALLVASAATNQIMQKEEGSKSRRITWFDLDATNPYKMVTCYFNSVRELGGFSAMVEDDIPIRLPDILKLMVKQKNPSIDLNNSFFNRAASQQLSKKELTGRISDDELAKQLSDLENGNIPDILQCTNMISVGIDLSNLNIMMVAGQPKRTSEYIQASSRTGRNPNIPGIVVMLYNPMRIRDASFYEFFYPYHQSFYRYVEPVSVTPYSRHSLTRGLLAQIVSIMRQVQLEANDNGNDITITIDDVEKNIYKLNRIVEKKIGQNGFDRDYQLKTYTTQLGLIINQIKKFLSEHQNSSYTFIAGKYNADNNRQYVAKMYGEIQHPEAQEIMSSLRNVSGECFIKLIEE